MGIFEVLQRAAYNERNDIARAMMYDAASEIMRLRTAIRRAAASLEQGTPKYIVSEQLYKTLNQP